MNLPFSPSLGLGKGLAIPCFAGSGPGSGSGSVRSTITPSQAVSLRSSNAIPKASVPALIRLVVAWRDPSVTAP
ncbi:MAG TPA: hypothetical protein VFV30_10320 [Novosphingobium sp.]|nr:hypothetical protein [Novosphingobium sp.]